MFNIRKTTKYALIIVISLLVITAIRLTWMHYLSTLNYPTKPAIHQGVVDLRGWTFTEKQTLRLDGEWEFIPSVFVDDRVQTTYPWAHGNETLLLQVPGSWDRAFTSKEQAQFHYGTYRLRIFLDQDHNDTLFAMRLTGLRNASSIYVNSELMAREGMPSTTLDEHEARDVPYNVKLIPHNGELEIVIHASSHTGKGGIINPIRFGTFDAIQYRTQLSINMQSLFCVVLLLQSIYALILYFLSSLNRSLLYFSLLLFSAILSVLMVDDKLLLSWLHINYNWVVKISYLSYIGVSAFLPLLMHRIFLADSNHRILRGFVAYCILYALFVLVAPEHFILTYRFLLTFVLVATVIVTLHIIWLVRRQLQGVMFLLLAVLFLGINIAWTSFERIFIGEIMHYPFDLIWAILAFATFWFRTFFITITKTEQLAAQLQEEDRRKDEFLVNTSHELRNPLHGIINISQAILDDATQPIHAKHKQRLDILVNVSKRLSLMLDDLVDVTRLREKTIHLQWEHIDLKTIVAGIYDMVKLLLAEKPVTLKMDIDDTFPHVKGDKNRVIQIMFNLLHNAMKYTDEGTITIRAMHSNGWAHIEVEDTGIGIEEKFIDAIFQPYKQAELNAERASGGFGLGLSIVKQLVELHGGTLTVQSSPGQGSTFRFTLPLSDSSPDSESSRTAAILPSEWSIAPTEGYNPAEMKSTENEREQEIDTKAATVNKPKILLVDDDIINLHILANMLETEQYEVSTAKNAMEAMEIVKLHTIDVVISDVMMPNISGYELTRMIRERYSRSELPILLLTARSRPQDTITGYQSGANDYVIKPVDAWELKAKVRALTELKLSIEEHLRMEGAWLQSQIRPHFLFNTLNSIVALGLEDFDKMQALLEEFSRYLRLSFDFHNAQPLVPYEDEMELVRSYLYIEKQRFGERLQVEWELNPSPDLQLPPLSIQPLVENAIQHGIMQRTNGGTIWIRISEGPEYHEICVQDDGKGMSEEQLKQLFAKAPDPSKGSGVGLRNVDRRLTQLFGRDHNSGLSIDSTPDKGTTITFRIPK